MHFYLITSKFTLEKEFLSFVFFILQIYKMKKIMKEKNQVAPDKVLSKESLSQFKTEADVSRFLKQLHVQVLEKSLKAKWMPIWAMKRILWQEVSICHTFMEKQLR